MASCASGDFFGIPGNSFALSHLRFCEIHHFALDGCIGMFINADEFFYNLLAYRVLWIRGRLGGGKTLLAVAIADELLKRHGFTGVIANFPHVLKPHNWRERMDDGSVRGVRGAVVVWDEAGVFIDRRTFARNDRGVGAFLRKLNNVLLLPSVIPVDIRLSYFSVQREVRVSAFGERWRYRWMLALPGAQVESGTFWLEPNRYFGTYDTQYVPSSDGGYMDLWRATITELGADRLMDTLYGEKEIEAENAFADD